MATTHYVYDENVDLDEWGALFRASIDEKARELETDTHNKDKQNVAWLLRHLHHQISEPDPVQNAQVCVTVVRQWGDVLLRHLVSANQERENDGDLSFDPTPQQDYDTIIAFFFVLEKIRRLRNRMDWSDEQRTADVISELMHGAEDVGNRIPTNRWNWKADQQQIQYFLSTVLEASIFSQYAALLPSQLPSYHFGDIRGVGPDYLGGEEASDNTTMYITLALGAGVLWYLNTKGYLKT